jgi:hypothetical protein
MSKLGTYYLAATIVDHQALGRMNSFRKEFLGYCEDLKETHLTILPPFKTSFEAASDINFGCDIAFLKSMHPTHTTIFEMRGLEILKFGGEDFLVCPVTPYVPSGSETWGNYVLRVRERLTNFDIEYAGAIPDEYRPHATVCRVKDVSVRRTLSKAIAESRRLPPLYFRVTYLVLHAKYKHGYAMLSDDPARE